MIRSNNRNWKKATSRNPTPVSPISRAELALRVLVPAISDIFLASAFLVTWAAPYTLGKFAVRDMTSVMMLELLALHSAAFFGPLATRELPLRARATFYINLLLGYSVLALVAYSMTGSGGAVLGFVLAIIGKAPSFITPPLEYRKMARIRDANNSGTILFYLSGSIATMFFIHMPTWGITPEVVAAQDFAIQFYWSDYPHVVMLFGAIYFSCLALLHVITELYLYDLSRQ